MKQIYIRSEELFKKLRDLIDIPSDAIALTLELEVDSLAKITVTRNVTKNLKEQHQFIQDINDAPGKSGVENE